MKRLLLLLPVPLLLLAVAGAGDEKPAAPADGYVGPDACRSCHVDLHDAWGASAHARSTEPATPTNLPAEMLEGKLVDHAPGESRFRRDGDRVLVSTLGPDGEIREYPVTHIVGPRRVSFFLTRLEQDRLQVLPAMREVTTGAWFDYTHLIFGVPDQPFEKPPEIRPGEPSFWTGPLRSYDRTCGRCHSSGRRTEVPLSDGEGSRMEWHPLSIDCEACHGPGAEHVEFWRNPPDRPAPDPILALQRIGRDRAQGLCLWCHMEAEVVREDYRPGDDVFEFLSPTLLDSVERIDAAGRPLELIYDGLPFLFSACAEAGGLTCLSCHDAHGSGKTADLIVPPDQTFTLCTGCHLDIAADARSHTHHDMARSGGRCVSCHMPYLTIERGHGAVRDHSLSSPMMDLGGVRASVDACTWCHERRRGAPEDAPVLGPEVIRSAFAAWYPEMSRRPGWVRAMELGREMRPEGFDALVVVAGDLDLPPAVRASAIRLLTGYPDRSLAYLREHLEDDSSLVRRNAAAALAPVADPDADLALLEILADPSFAVRSEAARASLSGYWRLRRNPDLLAAVLPILEADARAVPGEDSRWFRLGAARQLAGDVPGAIEAYERKLALDPYASLVRKALEELKKR